MASGGLKRSSAALHFKHAVALGWLLKGHRRVRRWALKKCGVLFFHPRPVEMVRGCSLENKQLRAALGLEGTDRRGEGERFHAGVGLAAPPEPTAPPKPTARARSGPLRGLEAVRGAEGRAGCFTKKFLAGCMLCRAGVWRTGLLGGLAARVFGHGKAASHQVGRSPSGWRPPLHAPFSPSQGMLDEIGDPK